MKRKARVARCYTEQTLESGTSVILDKRSHHHTSNVLRARVGQELCLFNGNGNNYRGHIAETGKQTRVTLNSSEPSEAESPLHITLIQAIARGDKMDLIIQKATELGVNAIFPVYSAHAITKLDATRAQRKLDHWLKVSISACEQCGRCCLPTIHAATGLNDALQAHSQTITGQRKWILSPLASASEHTNLQVNDAVVLIGPEAGFENQEVEQAEQHGFEPLKLGQRILRTETAAPAVLAILQAKYGDMQNAFLTS